MMLKKTRGSERWPVYYLLHLLLEYSVRLLVTPQQVLVFITLETIIANYRMHRD